VLVLSSVISAGYYLSVIAAMFMKPRREGQAVPSLAPLTNGLIAATAWLLLALGVYPTPVARLATLAVTTSPTSPKSPSGNRTQRVAPFSTASNETR
jgi:NADH-quinone oxidoreductase subunit N